MSCSRRFSLFSHRRWQPMLLAWLLAVLLPLLPALGTVVAAVPAEISISLLDTEGATLYTGDLVVGDLSFALDPYVPGATSDLSDPTPTALHALIALLAAEGLDPTDPAVLVLVDSAYGVYVDSILASAMPFYWTFRVDGADSWVGVFDHKLTPGESIEFVLTEYIPLPTPELGFVHPVSGLPLQPVDLDATLSALAAFYAGTTDDWAVLDMARAGQQEQVDRDGWLAKAYTRLTAPRVSVTDLELMALILTGLGYDARAIQVDGMETDLLARIADWPDLDTFGLIFGLAAFDSAGYPDIAGAENDRASMVRRLLDMRLADGGWSWALTEAISDTDTTAMAISVLARYADSDPDVADALTAAVALLSSWQAEDGTMGSSNATAMVLIALTAAGADAATDPRFAGSEGHLLDGLFRYRTADGRFGYKDTSFDAFATEQAFRALIVYRAWLATGQAGSPYVFQTTTEGLAGGLVLGAGQDVPDTGEATLWLPVAGFILLIAAGSAFAWHTRRRRLAAAEHKHEGI